MVKALDSQSRGLLFKITGLGGSKVDSVIHHSKVDKMSIRNSGNLVVKSKPSP